MRIFLIGNLLILLSSSANPGQLSYQTRVQSFSGSTDEITASLWAQNGFYSDAMGGARCCHCDSPADHLRSDPDIDWRSNHRPDCQLMRLLQILHKQGSVSDAEIARDSMRFEIRLKGLSAAFSDPVIKFVESFGYSKGEVALAVIKHFMNTDGKQQARPGDLIAQLQFMKQSLALDIHAIKLLKLLQFDAELTELMHNTQSIATDAARSRQQPQTQSEVENTLGLTMPDETDINEHFIGVSSAFDNILSERMRAQLRSLWRSGTRTMRLFLTGSLLKLLTSSISPAQLRGYHTGMQSLSVQTANRIAHTHTPGWAPSGFHSRIPDHQPDHDVTRLLDVLNRQDPVSDVEIARDAMRFERLLKSFYMYAADEQRSTRLGDLIELIHSNETSTSNYENAMRLLSISPIMQELRQQPRDNPPAPLESRADDAGLFRVGVNRPQPQTQDEMANARNDSPLCIMCKSRQKDRILLPCAHLMFCKICVRTLRKCPICDSKILAEVIAFLC